MRAPILFSAAPERARALTREWAGLRPTFACVLAHTDTCLIPNVSAAGVSLAVRPLTPAADAEVVHSGVPHCLPMLPSNPRGGAGPAGITRAALSVASIEARFFATGLQVWPQTPCERVSQTLGGDIRLANAVPPAADLFELGQVLGRGLGAVAPYLVLAESVPGGTTTALALLLALGYAAEGRVSGSLAGNAHDLKTRVARSALFAARLSPGDGRADPLNAVRHVGDPMQPLAAGMAVGALQGHCDVLLAGGSQMLAVAALVEALEGRSSLERMAIGTTRWIVDDPAADIVGLAGEIAPDLPVLAANLDFARSRHPALRAYEQWRVKEGVGAGGACIAAILAMDLTLTNLQNAIDTTYDVLLGRLPLSADR